MHLKNFTMLCLLTLLMLALAAPVAAQAPSCAGRFAATVTVTISSTGTTATVSPERACVARGGTVNFTSKDGDSWIVDFPSANASPSADGAARRQGKANAPGGGRVKPCAKNSPFFNASAGGCVYKFKATHVRGNQKAEVDPDVTVEP